METPYSKTDKTIEYLNKQYGKLFRQLTSFDELNVIQVSHDIYDKVYEIVKKEADRLSEAVYRSHKSKDNETEFNGAAFIALLVLAYNPVTKYVFDNEIERKRARFAESVIASDTPMEDVARAKRALAGMNAQFMDDVTFDTLVRVFEDNGTKFVRWVTSPDDRRCSECASRHNKIYPIDGIPAKPHIHCRCWIEEVTTE